MKPYITPPVALAPLAGVSNRAYRTVCAECGCVSAVTEMVSAKAISYRDAKSLFMADVREDIIPVAIQLFGHEPEVFRAAVYDILRFSPPAIDINMGCPVSKIAGHGEGAALMLKPELAGQIVAAACAEANVPVTVKMRSGWDFGKINAPEIAKICEQNGASAVAVHARTRSQGYSGFASHEVTAAVKRAVSIPVIANGDIVTFDDVKRVTEQTSCDGVMIGRGAYGDPWVFGRIGAAMRSEPYEEPTAQEKKRVIKRHILLLCELSGERTAVAEARGFVVQYVKGLPGAAAARRSVNTVRNLEELLDLVEGLPL